MPDRTGRINHIAVRTKHLVEKVHRSNCQLNRLAVGFAEETSFLPNQLNVCRLPRTTRRDPIPGLKKVIFSITRPQNTTHAPWIVKQSRHGMEVSPIGRNLPLGASA